jgi:hypothetical protein
MLRPGHQPSFEVAMRDLFIAQQIFFIAAAQMYLEMAKPILTALFPSKAARAIERIDQSHYGEHMVIHATFRKK